MTEQRHTRFSAGPNGDGWAIFYQPAPLDGAAFPRAPLFQYVSGHHDPEKVCATIAAILEIHAPERRS